MDKELEYLNNLMEDYVKGDYPKNGSKLFLSQNIFEEIIRVSKIYKIDRKYKREIHTFRNSLSHNGIVGLKDGTIEMEDKIDKLILKLFNSNFIGKIYERKTIPRDKVFTIKEIKDILRKVSLSLDFEIYRLYEPPKGYIYYKILLCGVRRYRRLQ